MREIRGVLRAALAAGQAVRLPAEKAVLAQRHAAFGKQRAAARSLNGQPGFEIAGQHVVFHDAGQQHAADGAEDADVLFVGVIDGVLQQAGREAAPAAEAPAAEENTEA